MTALAMAGEPCRSCSAPVVWCDTSRGKSMPVDAAPTPGGNLLLEQRPGRAPLVHVLGLDAAAAREDLHKSHFVTCPQAGQWRKRRPS